jgi:hypothetical protein
VVILSVLVALLVAGLIYGLSYEFEHATSAKTLPITATMKGVGEEAGLELTMTVEKTEYSLGEPINITFAVTNISNQTITVDESDHNFDFYIFNNMNSTFYNNMDNITYFTSIVLSNTTVYWYQYGRIQIPLEIPSPLSAGESLKETLVWGQTYSTPLVEPDENVAVSPGTYYIVGLGICGRTPPLQIKINKT